MIQPAFHMEPPAAPAAPTPPSTQPAPPTMSLHDAILSYRKIRDKQDEIEDRHAEELKPYKDTRKQLEAYMQALLLSQGMNKASAPGAGTVYTSTRRSVSIENPAEFRAWVEAQGRPDFYENRVSKEALDTYLEEGGALPPGLKVSQVTTVNIRK